jgi:hypothetical protein
VIRRVMSRTSIDTAGGAVADPDSRDELHRQPCDHAQDADDRGDGLERAARVSSPGAGRVGDTGDEQCADGDDEDQPAERIASARSDRAGVAEHPLVGGGVPSHASLGLLAPHPPASGSRALPQPGC